MKFYTTSQAIRILERYPDRGYMFEAPNTADLWPCTARTDSLHIEFVTHFPGNDGVDSAGGAPIRSDWLLVRPKRKRGRSVALGEAKGGACNSIEFTNPQTGLCSVARLPTGAWTLIAVEKADG